MIDIKLLTVVIITKESTSKEIKRTLDSLYRQKALSLNIIVVDINMQDSEYSFGLQEDLTSYFALQYYQFNSSKSYVEIYNYFVDKVKEGFISFFTLKDYWNDNAVEIFLNQFSKNENLAATFYHDNNHSYIDKLLSFKIKASSQVMYSVRALKSIGGFKEEYNIYTDTDALLRLSKNYDISSLNLKLGHFFLEDKSETYKCNELKECKRLHLENIDLFIPNKKLNKNYYIYIKDLAKSSNMWLNYTLYIILYLIKYPLSSIYIACLYIIRIFKKTYYLVNHSMYINLNIFISYFRARRLLKGKKIKSQSIIENKEGKKLVIDPATKIIKKGEFFNNKDLEIIEISSRVTHIKSYAFASCPNLKEVIIDEDSQLSKINPYAFAFCSSLEKISFPQSISHIAAYAFLACTNLREFIFNGRVYKVDKYAFAGCSSLKSPIFSQVDSMFELGKGAFMNCTKLAYFQLSTNLEEINEKTFYRCASLKSIKIHKKVRYIHDKAFKECASLEKAVVLSSDLIISSNAFDEDTKIEKLHDL